MKRFWLLCIFWTYIGAVGAWGQTGNEVVWDGQTVDTNWSTNYDNTDNFEISTAAQLAGLAQLVNGGKNFSGKTIKLTDNIVLNNNVLSNDGNFKNSDSGLNTWTPIGTSSYQFKGTFDGDGHTVKGIYINGDASYLGLFGYLGKDNNENTQGEIKNVGVVDSYIAGDTYIGGVCGRNTGSITSCYNTGSVTASASSGTVYAGGVCGSNGGSITSCYNTGSVMASANNNNNNAYVGGVCGYNDGSKITSCYNTGSVTASANNNNRIYAGGVCGYNYSSLITSCYNTGNVKASSNYSAYAGGVCGRNDIGSTITSCYSIGGVTASANSDASAGGVCGSNKSTITTSGYLEGSAGKGIGSDTGTTGPNDAKSVTPDELVTALNGIQDTNGKSPWKENARYENGKLTLPTLGNETAPAIIGQEPKKDNDGTYLIANPAHLRWFAEQVNHATGQQQKMNAKLMNDITLSNLKLSADGTVEAGTAPQEQWTPIGSYSNFPFTGTFDGDGHVVKGIYIEGDASYLGLFGYLSTNGEIKNVGVVDSYIAGDNYIGGVCGCNDGGKITSCYNTGSVKASGDNNYAYAGGVCGYNGSGTITSCYNTGSIEASGGTTRVGGVCGYNSGGTITSCYNTGSIAASGGTTRVGGVCGYNDNATITTSGYLEGSAGKGVGNNTGTTDPDDAKSVTPAELVKALNDIEDDDKNSPWSSKASYEKGKLTLPTLGNETPPTTSLAVVTEEIVKKATLIDYRNETIAENADFEVSTTGNFASLINPGTEIEPGKDLYIRYQGGKHDGKISETLKITLPSRPAAPSAAPVVSTKTSTSITLQAVNGQEYKLGTNGNWQTEATFNGLAPETSYTFYARFHATDTDFASETSVGTTIATTEAETPGPDPDPTPKPEPTPDPDPVFYTYTIPTVTGAIVEGAGSDEAEEGTRISFRLHLDPRGNGVYPEVSANHWWNTVSHDGNGTYSFRLYEDTRIEIGTVDYTLYEVSCPADTTVNADGTYTTGAGLIATDADGHAAQAFPYAATVSLTAPNNDHRRFLCWWDLTRRQPYTLVLTDDLTATATFEPLHPVANATIALPDGALRIATGRGYIEVQLSKEATPPSVSSQPVRLYSLAGSLLRQASFDRRTSAPLRFDNLPAGTYLVACGSFRQKVMVR
ncbi:GLUG motif-containing protein [Parabacteroides sp.]